MRVLLLLASLQLLAAQRGPVPTPSAPRPLARSEKGRLAALLPDPDVLSARSAKSPAFYTADLYKYIDGGADAYHKRGFVGLIHQEYRAGEVDLTVDIYDMGNPTRAAAMYSVERPPDCPSAPIAAENCVDGGALDFRLHRYYVKLMTFGPQAQATALAEKVARAVSARIRAAQAARRQRRG